MAFERKGQKRADTSWERFQQALVFDVGNEKRPRVSTGKKFNTWPLRSSRKPAVETTKDEEEEEEEEEMLQNGEKRRMQDQREEKMKALRRCNKKATMRPGRAVGLSSSAWFGNPFQS